jgi:hypothetical protein
MSLPKCFPSHRKFATETIFEFHTIIATEGVRAHKIISMFYILRHDKVYLLGVVNNA